MDLKDWFANRQKRKQNEQFAIKEPAMSTQHSVLWIQCFSCRELLYRRDLRSNLFVCPKCKADLGPGRGN